MAQTEREYRRLKALAELAALEEEEPKWDEYPESHDIPFIDHACTYLCKLRESGETNMFEASAYLIRRYGLSKKEASSICSFWMENFKELEAGRRAAEVWREKNAQALASAPSKEERLKIIKALPTRPF